MIPKKHDVYIRTARKFPDITMSDTGQTVLPENASAVVFVPGEGFSFFMPKSKDDGQRPVEDEVVFLSGVMVKASNEKDWVSEFVKNFTSGAM